MWAVVAGPVADERAAAFADTAPVVALHLLRRRAREDAERRRTAELVRAVLEGTGSVRLAAAELDLPDEPHRVVAMAVRSPDPLGAEGLRLALWERITAGVGRQPAVAELRDVLYAVVPERSGWPALRQALAGEQEPLVAAGPPVPLAELARSRTLAEEMLNLLRTGLIAGPQVSHEDAWQVLVLHRSATGALAAGATEFGPLSVLRAQDEQTGTSYVDTLYEWLRHPGDPRAASKALRIHPNTLRYRMAKLVELAKVDLDDPDTRLALLVQLAAIRWA
jgi:hypothetical protein